VEKILIVEDDLISAEYLKEIVKRAGYEVIKICTKGQEAIDIAIHNKPDIILMDIMLKDNISGCDAAKYLLNIIDTKVIFISAYSDPEMIDCAIDAEAADYIVKPYQDEQIITTIKIVTKKSNLKEIKSSIINLANNYTYDIEKKELLYFGNRVDLKANKIKLIDMLVKEKGKAISYEQIINNLFKKDVNQSALRTFVSRLNKKLGYQLIQNVSSLGYKIEMK